jgi:hypothetical protein
LWGRDGEGGRRTALGSAALAALLAACAQPAPPPGPRVQPETIVAFDRTGQPARDLLELVAAQCWLDGVVRGASMIVDRQNGRVIIVSDTEELLEARFLSEKGGQSRVRLTGPVVDDPVKTRRLVETLDLAAATGKTDCPIATG